MFLKLIISLLLLPGIAHSSLRSCEYVFGARQIIALDLSNVHSREDLNRYLANQILIFKESPENNARLLWILNSIFTDSKLMSLGVISDGRKQSPTDSFKPKIMKYLHGYVVTFDAGAVDYNFNLNPN